MRSPEIKPSQRRYSFLHTSSSWKESRLVVAVLSAAGTATLFATVIMPLTTTILTNKLEKLTETAGNAAAVAEELEETKKKLVAARAELRLATMKSPLIPDGIYPIGYDQVVLGTSAQDVLTRLQGSKWDEDNRYISFYRRNGFFLDGAAYYFDDKRRVSRILYHFNDPVTGSELIRKILLTRYGEPYAQKKGSALWRVSEKQWVSVMEIIKGTGFNLNIESSPAPWEWGDVLDTRKKRN